MQFASRSPLEEMAWTAVARFFRAAARSSAASTDLGLGTSGRATPFSRGKFAAASRANASKADESTNLPLLSASTGFPGKDTTREFARFFRSTLNAKTCAPFFGAPDALNAVMVSGSEEYVVEYKAFLLLFRAFSAAVRVSSTPTMPSLTSGSLVAFLASPNNLRVSASGFSPVVLGFSFRSPCSEANHFGGSLSAPTAKSTGRSSNAARPKKVYNSDQALCSIGACKAPPVLTNVSFVHCKTSSPSRG